MVQTASWTCPAPQPPPPTNTVSCETMQKSPATHAPHHAWDGESQFKKIPGPDPKLPIRSKDFHLHALDPKPRTVSMPAPRWLQY